MPVPSKRPRLCRYIAGRRLPRPRRPFHTCTSRRREDDPADTAWNNVTEEGPGEYRLPEAFSDVHRLTNGPDDGSEPPKPKDRSNYGSASRRAGRNIKRVKELPQVHIPPWFIERNIRLLEVGNPSPNNAHLSKDVAALSNVEGRAVETSGIEEDHSEVKEKAADSLGGPGREKQTGANGLLTLDIPAPVLGEVISVINAGLQVPSAPNAELSTPTKPHVVLFCPKFGASQYLSSVARGAAGHHKIDFLRLDAQDIAEIGGNYMEEASNFRASTLSSLGYDAPLVNTHTGLQMREDPAEEEDYDEVEEEDSGQDMGRPATPFQQGRPGVGVGVIPVGSFVGSLQDVFKSIGSSAGTLPNGFSTPSRPFMIKSSPQVKDNTPDLKMTLLVETLLNSAEMKREAHRSTADTSSPLAVKQPLEEDPGTEKPSVAEPKGPFQDAERGSEGLVVLVEDYPQINATTHGGKFLDKLHEVVDARRREGQRVLIVGTASSKDIMPSFSKAGIDEVQSEPSNGPTRSIVVPIDGNPADRVLEREHQRKVRAVNLRHLRDMLRRMAPHPGQVDSIANDWEFDVDNKTALISGLDESIWSMDRVNRIATTALGAVKPSNPMTTKIIEDTLQIIEQSDVHKLQWVLNEKNAERKSRRSESPSGVDSEERMRKLRRKCNAHEKKLLNGVVDADSIRTTFADVQAPPEMIDALKTLTSLSLVRPDAFTYGVLATDRIPGLLLYGPPGTGKTLLAKAVAKESGATVLEVSGSDVYDMYVGEGEKNVRAIFSLAKKLTPCIVFIDEADAILGSRSSGSSRTSHRELINQFLREWDGMTDLSAFIMVATNRPFDLDEACLRRLPRRLLVDLPVEKDREAILQIHLKDEVLDPDVSLSQLAAQTPFYSGSDLKNLAVAAALSCVREEFDTAATHNKDSADGDKYTYDKTRTLYPRHFTKAMEEISASISEDMGSLSAIRKFDEKYGDRRGRRKKLGGYGFKTVSDAEKMGSDAARVRNQT